MTDSEPGVVYSVKELIGRLEGKLEAKIDTFIEVVMKKADREDVDAVHRRVDNTNQQVANVTQRVDVVEDTVRVIQALTAAQQAAAVEKSTAVEKIQARAVDRSRWIIGILLATLTVALGAVGLLIQFHAENHR